MAQRSLPQAGTGIGDSGPYSSDEWAEYFQTVFTGDQQATQGPVRHFLNELEVTEAALAVTTDTGAGFVYGHFLINDVAVVINVALAAAGLERYDRVVMVQNNTNVAYNTNLALPAAYAAGVPRNSARIAILQGTEAGAAVLPPLLTGPNYYMVELARYLVDDAAVGAVTDYRDYASIGVSEPSTQYLFIPALAGVNVSAGTNLALYPKAVIGASLQMPTNNHCYGYSGRFVTPSNYLSTMVAQAVVYNQSGSSGNLRVMNTVSIGALSESSTSKAGYNNAATTEAVLQSRYTGVSTLNILPLVQGDIIGLRFDRYGNDALDTLFLIDFLGWLISYTTLT